MGFAGDSHGDVRFTIYSEEKGSQVIEDPKNWDESEREYTRNSEFNGIFSKISNSLEFAKSGFKYLLDLYIGWGINPDIKLTKEVKNPNLASEDWTIVEEGYPNLSTFSYNEENRLAKVKFDEEPFWQKINNRKKEKYDLGVDTSPDDIYLGELPTRTMYAHGRKILLNSYFEIDPVQQPKWDLHMRTFGSNQVRTTNKGLPFKIIANSDQENITNTSDNNSSDGYSDDQNGSGTSEFFLSSDVNKFGVKFKMTFTFTLTRVFADDTENESLNFFFRRYNNADQLDLAESTTILSIANPQNKVGETFTISHEVETDIAIGDSFAYIAQGQADRDGFLHNFSLDCDLSNLEGSLQVIEDSAFPVTQHEVLLPFEKFDRLTTILTGEENKFYSEYFGRTELGYDEDGEGAYKVCATGYQVRGFPRLVNEGTDEERITQYNTSFTEAFTSYNSDNPLAVIIENSGTGRRLRIEPLSFVYQKFSNIQLKNSNEFLLVTNLERKVDMKRIYSHVEFGSKNGGTDYEEAFGLDEYNGKTEGRTVINKVENTYTAISDYRKDSYGHEFCRRQQFSEDPDADTRYDEHIFMLDCIFENNTIRLKLWSDDFEEEPTGIYSPETAFNLNMSPANALMRHSAFINAGLQKNQEDFITLTSSNANSSLVTKKSGQSYLPESGDISNSELLRPFYIPELLEFDCPIDIDLLKSIEGLNSENIANVYGFMVMKTRSGFEQVYIDSVKISDGGKFVCTKAWL